MTSDLSATALRDTVAEMAKQASLGHTKYCVGVHESGEAEWIDWPEAFAPLLAALARLQEERDAARAWIAERVAEVPEVKAELRNLERSLAALGKENVILRAELAAARDGGTA